jgi:hypothetical protein
MNLFSISGRRSTGATFPSAPVLMPALVLALALALPSPRATAAPVPVQVVQRDGRWQLLRGGEPYVIRGAGGDRDLELLAARGGNSLRTWGADDLGPLLDQAQRLGLTVTVGFWLGHERHGFDYGDPKQVAAQQERVRQGLLAYRDHPAVLAWAMGNEMEGFADGANPAIWAAVDSAAALAHRLDPNHPTLTVTADIGGERVACVHRLCPDIDIMGINSYGGAPSLPERYRQAGGTKPYLVTEYGPPGTWEIGRNAWGAVEELSSTAKADRYRDTYRTLTADSTLCLGSYAFVWGAKPEATPTWYGLLLPDGSRLAGVDALGEAWSGRPAANRCPAIDRLELDGPGDVKPGATVRALLVAHDAEGDPLAVTWVLARDAMQYETGGDAMPPPREFPAALVRADTGGAAVKMPRGAGGYRLFATVRDGQGGAAVANLPLHVQGKVAPDAALEVPLPFTVVGDEAPPGYAPSGWMGDIGSLTMDAACAEQPHAGARCLKFTYDRLEGWAGVVWQHPANDWGDRPGGFDLGGAKRLVFWARGALGGEIVKFGFGLLDDDKPYSDSGRAERRIVLTPEWRRYEIGLGGKSLHRIKSGFWWTLGGQGRPVTFYLDDVRYE